MPPTRAKEKERFYLLPGQGGKAYRRKRNLFLAWSVVTGVLVSVVLGLTLYFVNSHGFHVQ
ncbi:MAG: hypothetical protein JWR26_3385 [Pedosphaera sp.]|nr:hypothetical protein [Pedosphaera sp.]